jgi:hypothetical protein
MEIFRYILILSVIVIISCIISAIIYFNKYIQAVLFDYSIENFILDDKIGLKWLYLGNEEPDGDKISNEKLFIILNYKWISPIVISVDELDSLNIGSLLSANSYIDVDGRYFKPYNSAIDNIDNKDIGLLWRNLGERTEPYVKKYYREIKNDKLEKALEDMMKNKSFNNMDGESVYRFTREEYDNIKENSVLSYDSYIIVGENNQIMQPYYKHKIVETNSIFTDDNIETVLRRGFDNRFMRSSAVKTQNTKTEEYFNTDIYNNKGVSNAELHFSTETATFRRSNDVTDGIASSILEPIEDKYLPYIDEQYNRDPQYLSEKSINEYVIIDIYKNILDRHPKPKELIVNLQDFYEKNSNEDKLKLKLYNSTEYKMIVKMQSNNTDPTLISNISEQNIIDNLVNIYRDFFNKLPHDKMRVPLKQCYIHLQFNDYLFKAMLMHDNYSNFERSILREYIINDEKLLEIFDNNFVLYEIRLIANELKRRDIIKRRALTTPIALATDTNSSTGDDTNLNSDKHIADIMKNSEPVFNINIIMQDKNTSMPYKSNGSNGSFGSNGSNGSGDTDGSFDPSDLSGHDTSNLIYDPYDIKNPIIKGESNRIYDPITYKQQYRGPMEYRPNVCSYGTKQITNPLYLNSPGTDLKEAVENTQVGSIMPKFIYREYEDVKK